MEELPDRKTLFGGRSIMTTHCLRQKGAKGKLAYWKNHHAKCAHSDFRYNESIAS